MKIHGALTNLAFYIDRPKLRLESRNELLHNFSVQYQLETWLGDCQGRYHYHYHDMRTYTSSSPYA